MSELTPTTGKDLDIEVIDHPPHYNHHPSGVEAIEICRHLNFNIGNAFKYVYRMGAKYPPEQRREGSIKDLKKALWYIDDELKTNPKKINAPVHKAQAKVRMVLDAEPRELLKNVFYGFYLYSFLESPLMIVQTKDAVLVLLANLQGE